MPPLRANHQLLAISPIKRPKPEEIVVKLRQVEVFIGQGMPRIDAIRQISVTEQTYYRWKKKYGGMGTEQLKELRLSSSILMFILTL